MRPIDRETRIGRIWFFSLAAIFATIAVVLWCVVFSGCATHEPDVQPAGSEYPWQGGLVGPDGERLEPKWDVETNGVAGDEGLPSPVRQGGHPLPQAGEEKGTR